MADLLAEGTEGTNGSIAPDGRVRVVAVARVGSESALASYAVSAGAAVAFRDDAVGYFELLVPRTTLLPLSSHPSVEAFDIDGQSKAETLARGELSCTPGDGTPQPRRARTEPIPLTSDTARVLQETGYAAMGIDVLLRDHPTFDGRGVTIAMIDGLTTGLPIAHPAFRTAKDLTGAPIPKIRDMVIVTPTWRSAAASTRVGAGEGYAAETAHALTLPHAGEFRMGTVETPWQKYTFVWDTAARTVWVDTNRNGDFRDDPPVRDARAFPDDIGEFPDAKSSLGAFRVTTVPDESRVIFHAVSLETSSNHAAMDVAIAAGNDAFIHGVAPGASLVLFDPTNDTRGKISDIVRTLIRAARRPDVDIISMSFAVSTSPVPTDDVVSIVSDRLVRQFHKILVTAASNLTWRDVPDAVGMYSVSVGAYMPGEVARYLGWTTDRREHWILPYSTRGPRGDGDARPDVVAPAVWMSLGRCDAPSSNRAPCAALSGGTSAAAPALAGAVALLVSGAKQRGLRLAGEEARMLLRASATHLPGWRVDEQGAGVPNIAAAWKLLTSQDTWPTITGSSSLDDARRPFLSTRGRGRGIYEKSWTAGKSGEAIATLARVSGVAGAQRFDLDWTGNDGTFKSPVSIELGLNTETPLKIAILPRTTGVHSALLNFRDRTTGRVVHQEQVTVSASGPPDQEPLVGSLSSVSRLGQTVSVPPGTTALRMRVKADGVLNIAATSPSGWAQSPLSILLDAQRENGVELVLPEPAAGTWEFSAFSDIIANGRIPIQYAMSMSLLEMDLRNVEANVDGTVTAQIELRDEPHMSWSRDVRGRLGTTIHDTRGEVSVFRQDVQQMHVEPGVSSVLFRVSASAPVPSGLSMYVYDCSSGSCKRANAGRTYSGEAALRFDAPRSGLWKVIVMSDDMRLVPYRLDVIAVPPQPGVLGLVACRPEGPDRVQCVASGGAESDNEARAVLFDVNARDETLGRAFCVGAYNRAVPVGLVMDLPRPSTPTGRSERGPH